MLDAAILDALRNAVDTGDAGQPSGLITSASQLQTYECDGLTNFRVMPGAVVLPRSAEQVQAVVRICAQHGVPFVARGSGTGLSGGALPAAGGVVISFARMNRILEIDIPNQRVVVEPGVINSHVTDAVAAHGYFYAPDPSSQSVCTIGGNVAENSGGAHCLRSTALRRRMCWAWMWCCRAANWSSLDRPRRDAPGYDLTGVFVGSEGTLGSGDPHHSADRQAARDGTGVAGGVRLDAPAAAQAVSDIIAAGMLPAALEMMDRLSAQASEAAVHPKYPVSRGTAAGGTGRSGA